MKLRIFEKSDAPKLAKLFYETIHTVNVNDYTPEQINVWAPPVSSRDPQKWLESFSNKYVIVAAQDDALAGFGELEPNGHIDRFYISHEFIGMGVGKMIYEKLEKEALKHFLPELFVEASITAKPFFGKMGFVVEKRQTVYRSEVGLDNFVMRKKLVDLV